MSDLATIADTGNTPPVDLPTCDHCKTPFQPRRGGKPQRFCSEECRRADQNEQRANAQASGALQNDPGHSDLAGGEEKRPLPSSTEFRAFMIRALKDFDKGMSDDKAAETVDDMISTGHANYREWLERQNSDDAGGEVDCWAIPAQERIEVLATNDGEIELNQISSMGPDEDQRIIVSRRNAVTLSYQIMWAAGFTGVSFATGGRGGYVDINPGCLPEDLED